jgi:hypothetical protein
MLIPFGVLSAAGVSAGFSSDYELISSTILGTATANIEFDNIPQTYKHLQVRLVGRSSFAANFDNLAFYLNNNTASNYATHALFGNGSSVTSNAFTSEARLFFPTLFTAASNTANAFQGGVIDILDYSSTTKNTTTRALTGVAASGPAICLISGLWNNTAAVTRINFENSGNFVTGTRFSLYGIRG